MRAVVVESFGAPELARVHEVDAPVVGPGQVLVQVAAAAVNPVDLVTRQGVLHAAGLHATPPVRLGWDVAGEIARVGPGVRRLRVGQPVIGLSDRLAAPSKTHAEQVVLDADAVATVPPGVDFAQIGALPLAGLTAWQALDRAEVGRGTSLLVTGAAGAVGSLVTQLALLRGATVFGAGRAARRPAIENDGATFVDASAVAGNVRDLVPPGVDAAVDTAGIGGPSLDAVRSAGRHVSLMVTQQPPALRGIVSTSLAVRAHWEQLTLLGALVATGAVRLPSVGTVALADATSAYTAAEAGSSRLVLVP